MSPGPNSSFTVSHDSTSKIVTGAVFVMLLATFVALHSAVAGILIASRLVAGYAWSPTGYAILDGAVIVRRLIGNVRIPLDGIRDVRIATIGDTGGSIRLFASGGLFGYYGIYRNSMLGKSTWYVTNRSRSVVVVHTGGTAILSPDDVGGFVAAARTSAAIKPARSGAAMFESLPDNAGGSGYGWLKAVVVIAVGAVVTGSLLYAPGPPAYTLTNQSLAIHDRFYPVTVNAANVDVANARVIDFNTDAEWQPVARTNGFGNVHYHAGWFRLADGKLVQMYRADGTRMVLLPLKGGAAPVLLETKEPDKFLAELRRKWGIGS